MALHASPSPYTNSSTPVVDPVTKAVVDNILGKLATKKERVTLTCAICNLDFSSQITLDMHLRGNRHSKKVRSEEILETLKEKGSIIDSGSTSLKCEICNVVSNSTQQLQMHLQGAKHQNKSKAIGASGSTITVSSLKRTGTATKTSDGTPPTKSVALRCETCNISLNSESQYQQHVDSNKHKYKLSGGKPSTRKWTNKHKSSNSYMQYQGNTGNYQNGRKPLLSGVPPLSQSFSMSNQGYDNYHQNSRGGVPHMW